MIEFSGEYSQQGKRFLLKENALFGFFITFCISIIFAALAVIISAVYNLWIITYGMGALLIFTIVLATVSPYIQRAKTLEMLIPKKIVFEDGMINIIFVHGIVVKPISNIKKVIDVGEWYQISFYRKMGRCICMKNLITQGTIEEFENLFEGKIVRNNNKESGL